MNAAIKTGRCHFLTYEQKQIKHKIIVDLLNVMSDGINPDWDNTVITDIMMSAFITFNREYLARVINNSGIKSHSEDFLDNIFYVIKTEVINQINGINKDLQ